MKENELFILHTKNCVLEFKNTTSTVLIILESQCPSLLTSFSEKFVSKNLIMLSLRTLCSLRSHRLMAFSSVRSISIGTDLISSCRSNWQKARPWYNSESEGSNMDADNILTMSDVFQGKTVVVFGVPAPFTGTCTHAHYPPFKRLASEFQSPTAAGSKLVDSILCYSVTDPYAMYGWSKSMGNDDSHIQFVADVDAVWAKEMGLDAEYPQVSLSVRSKRFSMLVKNGIVKTFHFVSDAAKDAEILLEEAKSN
jgi:glutaredoxin/glutathione-dependent peroxiredoxin